MQALDTAKRHTGFSGAAFREKSDRQPGSDINQNQNIAPVDLQVQRLNRRFGFAFETCAVIASLHYGESRR